MIDHGIIVRVQKDHAVLVHESWMSSIIFRPALSDRLAVFVLLWRIFSPYEEFVCTVLAIWASGLVRLKESCLPVGQSTCLIGMNYRRQRSVNTRHHQGSLTVAVIRVLSLCPFNENLPHVVMIS